ncbi:MULTISPECIES: hypothetical protein [unclassified Crossiella]|uniref:hypothetical protein n=1 Tax=unclassified Crossiella TaxID=2620835 RepID=UPI001FFFDE55|nr:MULTISPECIES: hypothetical protein [unclassified Crossiella]MCK2240043.1 hypothetical protein [Crossiella sp. S99.2]MCK2252751.1 hypothetical protein [Crossiella sp. S99.1]
MCQVVQANGTASALGSTSLQGTVERMVRAINVLTTENKQLSTQQDKQLGRKSLRYGPAPDLRPNG